MSIYHNCANSKPAWRKKTMNTQVRTGTDIADWRPEDEKFWESTGKKVAYRNLWISIPNLLCGFAVWAMWGIITVQMLNLGFPFKPAGREKLHVDCYDGGREYPASQIASNEQM